MRPFRTPAEEHAISALLRHLREGGVDVSEDPGFTDRPDAVFELGPKRVAIECRNFTPERILRMHGVDRIEGRAYEVYLPLEPNLWIQHAIEAKNHKVAQYKQRSSASECWLIVHTARFSMGDLAALYNSPAFVLFHMAVWQTPHDFDRIYLTGEFDLPPVCIFDRRNEAALRGVYAPKKLICINVQQYFFAYATATEGPHGQGQITIDLKLPPFRRFFLQPLDTRFRVDYDAIVASRAGDSLLASVPSFAVAQPIAGVPQHGYCSAA